MSWSETAARLNVARKQWYVKPMRSSLYKDLVWVIYRHGMRRSRAMSLPLAMLYIERVEKGYYDL